MAINTTDRVLTEAFWPAEGNSLWIKRAVLVVLGVVALSICAKIRVPIWPVPATLQTFGVLLIGATFGFRLGVVTLLAYIALGALGVAVFAGDSAGLAYLAGPTAGYLIGFVVAVAVVGSLARQGWDRGVASMVGALLIGNAIIYAFGMPWMFYLFLESKGFAWVMQWGMTNFLFADALKLALAALLVPALWKLVGDARA
jgi:biotin transport system substrate-specific component